MRSQPSFPEPAAGDDANFSLLAASFPLLSEIRHPQWREIVARAHSLKVDAKTLLMGSEDECESFVLLLKGTVRVYQLADDGREITLYRTFPGDICVMSIASLIHHRPFKANAQAETVIEGLALGAADFQLAMAISETFRSWVLSSLASSFCDMMQMVHGAVFDRMEMRLACLLGQLFERAGGDTVNITHQAIAQELGTTREVVSRSLKQLENQGCVQLSRGRIRIAPGQQLPGRSQPSLE
jgi:CRP/FNR family transcriptional regulator